MGKDEILVVGAGPTGLMMASELSRHGIKCRIIDKKPERVIDSRAVVVNQRTLEIYEDIGIIDEALKKGVKMTSLNMYSNGKKLFQIDFKDLDTRYNFALCMPESSTELMLINHLKSFGVEVERDVELITVEQHYRCIDAVLRQGEQILAPETFSFILGCDGAVSTCRRLARIFFPGNEPASFWGVFDASVDWSYDSQEGQAFIHEKGLVTFFPIPNNRMRVTYEIHPNEPLKELPKLTYEDTLAVLQERVSKDIKLIEPADLRALVILHRQVTQFRRGRIFLVGNATHCQSPAGGQGMNIGIHDAYNLAWKIALVHRGISAEELLNSYYLERHAIGKEIFDVNDDTLYIEKVPNRFVALLRDPLLLAIDHIDIDIKNQMTKNFSLIDHYYELNTFTYEYCEDHIPELARSGHRAPDHVLSSVDGEVTTLFKLFQGTHHTLLIFAGKKASTRDHNRLKRLLGEVKQYDELVRTYIIIRNEEHISAFSDFTNCYHDREPSIHTHYGIERVTAVIVRPDGVFGYINQPPILHKLNEYYVNKFER